MTNDNFDYGDVVRISAGAPNQYRPGSKGSVVGVRETDNDVILEDQWIPSGTRLLLVEFNDGSAVEMPHRFLESIVD